MKVFRDQSPRIQALFSMLDPIVSSAALFFLQGMVLLTSRKLDFAHFSLSYSYIVMGQAVMSALFGPPMITLLGHYDAEGQARVGHAVLRFQLLVGIAVASFGLIVATLFGIPLTLSVLGALGLLGLSFRDAMRSMLAAQSKTGEVLLLALSFALVVSAAVAGIYFMSGKVTSTAALGALAVATTLTVASQVVRCLWLAVPLGREALVKIGKMATWSLPGVVVIWLQNNFYLTIVAFHLSMEAVAEVSAARMVVMPAMVASTGVSRFFQVRSADLLSRSGLVAVLGEAKRAAIGVLFAGATLAFVAGLIAGNLGNDAVSRQYSNVPTLVVSWILFAACVIARGFYSSLFQAMGRYREIFVANVGILPLVLAGTYFGPLVFGISGVVLSLTVGELLLLTALMVRARFGKL